MNIVIYAQMYVWTLIVQASAIRACWIVHFRHSCSRFLLNIVLDNILTRWRNWLIWSFEQEVLMGYWHLQRLHITGVRGSLSFWFIKYWIGIKVQSCFLGMLLGNVSCYATWRTGEFGGPLELNFVKILGEQKEVFWDHSRLGVPVYCNCISLWENIISIIWVLLIALMILITHDSSLGKCRPKRNQLCLVKILILPQHINLCSCNWTSLGPCHPSMSHPYACMWHYVPGHSRTTCSTIKCLGTFKWWLIDHVMQSLFIISSKL